MTAATHLKVGIWVQTFAIGFLCAMLWVATDYSMSLSDKIKKLEADVRTETGRRLNAEERHSEELESVANNYSLLKWRLESELETCKKEKK
jgi:hypothetical protein